MNNLENQMKFTTYEEFRNATEEELLDIDPEDYTDEENRQISLWFIRAKQEDAFAKLGSLDNLTNEEIVWLGLDNDHILNNIISEAPENFSINGKTIKGRVIITRENYSIIKEDGKNNFYRIMNNE